MYHVTSDKNHRAAFVPLVTRHLSPFLARREGLEPPTNGFGDHYSTN
jgi:hypothetical protein